MATLSYLTPDDDWTQRTKLKPFRDSATPSLNIPPIITPGSDQPMKRLEVPGTAPMLSTTPVMRDDGALQRLPYPRLPNPLISQYKRDQASIGQPPALNNTIVMPQSSPFSAITAPIVPPAVKRIPTASENAQQAYNAEATKRAGVDNIHNPLLRGIAKAGDIAASVFAPRIAQYIPGTTLDHERQVGILANRAKQAESQDQAAAVIEDSLAQAKQREALAEQEQAKAQSLLHPKSGQLLYDKNGDPIGYQSPTGQYFGPDDPGLDHGVRDVLHSARRKQPTNAFELWQTQNPKGTAEDWMRLSTPEKDANLQQQYLDALQGGDTNKANSILKVIHDTSTQPKIDIHTASETPVGTWQPSYDKDGNAVLYNSKTGETRANTAGVSKSDPMHPKIGADEQKRADLARNLNENIDAMEEILQRRPDLFGPFAGRVTQGKALLGTDDADAASLMAIEHNLGMVAQGAHGMRSAQGVATAAQSLTNGFHNSPAATKAALETARQSVRTFLSDAQAPGQARSGGQEYAPGSHIFDARAWQQANPKGNVNAAIKKAIAAGYEVVK